MDVLALIGAIAGVVSAVGVPIAYLQLRGERANRRVRVVVGGADGTLAARFDDLSLFAPSARYRGFDDGMMDRRSESAALLRLLRAGRPVIVIEGIAGVGKTALAARLCRQLGRPVGRHWAVHWVFCDEKAVTLTALATALASVVDSPQAARLRIAVAREVAADVIDAVIELLAAHRLLLVLDNFHTVTDTGLTTLLARLAHSRVASSVVLTSRLRVRRLGEVPITDRLAVSGLSIADTHVLLRDRGVDLPEPATTTVWRGAGNGNPLALTLFAARARETDAEQLAQHLPDTGDELTEWIAMALDGISPDALWIAKIVAFGYEPVPREVLTAIAAPLDPAAPVSELVTRFLLREAAGSLEMHNAVRDHIDAMTTGAEQSTLATRFTEHYRSAARTVFLHGLGPDAPSYGKLYLESFPDYFAATGRHIRFVDDLVDRLADHGFALARGDSVLVLGSGDGTHDPGLAKHGFDVTNIDIQPEIAELGRAKAATLPAEIRYVVADMTEPLPADMSMAAVFNIGSSFGYESDDECNAMVFRNTARSLRPGAPFVFEYVNGPHWENRRIQRQVDVTPLPNGSTRTEVSITDPGAGTSLTLIGLRREDGTGGWFRHFMRYYRLTEVLDMMAGAGLRPVATYGARGGRVTGEPFDEQRSEAMVIIATT